MKIFQIVRKRTNKKGLIVTSVLKLKLTREGAEKWIEDTIHTQALTPDFSAPWKIHYIAEIARKEYNFWVKEQKNEYLKENVVSYPEFSDTQEYRNACKKIHKANREIERENREVELKKQKDGKDWVIRGLLNKGFYSSDITSAFQLIGGQYNDPIYTNHWYFTEEVEVD